MLYFTCYQGKLNINHANWIPVWHVRFIRTPTRPSLWSSRRLLFLPQSSVRFYTGRTREKPPSDLRGRTMKSIIKWSGSITWELVQHHKSETRRSECSPPRLSASVFGGHESRGGKLKWMPSPIFKPNEFFLPFICTLILSPRVWREGTFYWEPLAGFIARPYKLTQERGTLWFFIRWEFHHDALFLGHI